ncbi:DUF6900 domain-containing protein [Cypionkella sp. TWP1-2-1b2]
MPLGTSSSRRILETRTRDRLDFHDVAV